MSLKRWQVQTATMLSLLELVALFTGRHSGEAVILKEAAISLDRNTSSSSITVDRVGPPQNLSGDPTAPSYSPKQAKAFVHPTNFGSRFTKDIYGKPINHQAIAVLHETVGSAASTIRFFQTPHYQDNEQFSYHTLITTTGTVVYLVPPEKRAFGAGNSVFKGPSGPETVKTKRNLPPSVNNFAYHISLETPPGGNHNRSSHRGYTEAQYQSLAWLVARTKIPHSRITTHRAVDRSGTRQDPRSFNSQKFLGLLHAAARNNSVAVQRLK